MIITSGSSSSSSSMTKTKNKKPANDNDVASSSPAAPFLLQTIQRGDVPGPRNGCSTAAAATSSCSLLVATGIAGDAKYFVAELQTYVARIRHEFGTTLVPVGDDRLRRLGFVQTVVDSSPGAQTCHSSSVTRQGPNDVANRRNTNCDVRTYSDERLDQGKPKKDARQRERAIWHSNRPNADD
jgi:hypothetical protein